jgi:hypothetical protein
MTAFFGTMIVREFVLRHREAKNGIGLDGVRYPFFRELSSD